MNHPSANDGTCGVGDSDGITVGSIDGATEGSTETVGDGASGDTVGSSRLASGEQADSKRVIVNINIADSLFILFSFTSFARICCISDRWG